MNGRKGIIENLKIWVEEIRAPFLTATLVPILLGASIALEDMGAFHLGYFILTLVGGLCLHAGANVANDYFDHKSGNDDINVEFVRPFSGGSRLIQKGILSPRQVLLGSLLLYGAGCLIGMCLVLTRGLPILLLGLVGVFSGFFYTAPPFRISHRAAGELFVGLNFGVLMVLGAYYVQVQRLALEPLFASLPVSFLIAAILYINQFPDYAADKAVGKAHLVVRLGKEKASKGYVLLLAATYLSICAGVILGLISPLSLFGLLTLPMAMKASRIALSHYADTKALVPANAATIMIHLATGLLMCAGYLLDRFFL